MKLVLLRHGRTEANERHLYCGCTDLPLSPAGAEELRRRRDAGEYAAYAQGFDIYTSGMVRTEETLKIVLGDVPHQTDPDLREIDFGAFEMRSYEELRTEPTYQVWIAGDNEANVCPGGESGREADARALAALQRIVAHGRDAFVVTHGGVIAAARMAWQPGAYPHRYAATPAPGDLVVLQLPDGADLRSQRTAGVQSCCQSPDAAPLLLVESLAAGYGKRRRVVENVDVSVRPGEMLLLRGPNGAGKSTLLQCLAGVMSPISGTVKVATPPAPNPQPLAPISRRSLARILAYLPQQTDASALVGSTVRDVVALGRFAREGWLQSAGTHTPKTAPAIDSALSRMGLSALADRDATGLSGGESRRMYFAACLAQEAKILLLDEPFNQFDEAGRGLVVDALREHLASSGAVVLATHDEKPLAGLPYRVLDIADVSARQRRGTVGVGVSPDRGRTGTPVPPVFGGRGAPTLPHRLLIGIAAAFATAAFLVWTLFAGRSMFATPEQFQHVLGNYRLPRLLTALFAGGILSVAGLLYQSVFRNPMASPYTLGTASGAAFGAYLSVALGVLPLPVAAFAGALLSIAVVRVCAGRGGAARLLLSGIACSFLFSAASMLVQYRLDPQKTYGMVHWGFGSIVAAKPGALALLGAAFALAVLSGLAGRPLDALLAGDEAAASFGVPVRHVRMGAFLFSALLTSCAVSVCGPVGFVGLVVPHLVRMVAPGKHAWMLPATALFGGLFLALCDALPRALLGGIVPPVGVVTALVGAPVLLFLLGRSRR